MRTAHVALLLVAAALVLPHGSHAYANSCKQVPWLPNVDQSPSNPAYYGHCTDAVEEVAQTSNWCTFGKMGYWPTGASAEAKKCMKFARMTVYRGPVLGATPTHRGACNYMLNGSDAQALVAVSTKYLKTAQGGWVPDKGACGSCMCIRLHGIDDVYNPGVNARQKAAATGMLGLTFMAVVGDRCGECDDDHIDVLLDRPLAYSPYNANNPTENSNATKVNAWSGKRGFNQTNYIPGAQPGAPEDVGTWVADWQWVPCDWTHDQCASMMASMNYTVYTPSMSPGVNSTTLKATNTSRMGNTTTTTTSPTPSPVASSTVKVPTPSPSPSPAKSPTPSPASTSVPCTSKAASYAQCGGTSACPAGVTCSDAQWPGVCCATGFTCMRQNEYYWGCMNSPVPSPASSTVKPSTNSEPFDGSADVETAVIGEEQVVDEVVMVV